MVVSSIVAASTAMAAILLFNSHPNREDIKPPFEIPVA
jgi:hypothetical protein